MGKKIHSHFGVYGIIERDGKMLLIKKSRGPYEGMYDLPGGGPEENEGNGGTLIREVKEETGLDVVGYEQVGKEIVTVFYEYSLNGEAFLLKHSALIYHVIDYDGILRKSADGEDSLGTEWVEMSDIDGFFVTPLVKKSVDFLKTGGF